MLKRTARSIERELIRLGDKDIARHSRGFFKTGKGEYGEGDIFLGIRVPVIRTQVKSLHPLPLKTAESLLHSKYHEIRLFALLSLVRLYQKGDAKAQCEIYRLYLNCTQYINNWDLVDQSAYQIVGTHLAERSRVPLFILAKSACLWERRIAIIATFQMIRKNDFADSLRIAALLRDDSEDLIHKAVGWMLREIGKRDRAVEEQFLKKHYRNMPRTMLRYAIERFPERLRKSYLAPIRKGV